MTDRLFRVFLMIVLHNAWILCEIILLPLISQLDMDPSWLSGRWIGSNEYGASKPIALFDLST